MMHYRREIDGLRSVAVVPVILYHAGVSTLSGGYVGVDVFFVISGFLITSILIRELTDDQFSLLAFYDRRARRILPALGFVALVCVPFSIFWMLPFQLAEFGRSLGAVALFISNILFWRETDYFAAASEEKPLLHTWSLAVEEQFYILFPIALFLLWKLGRRALWVIFAAAFLGSLGLAEALSTRRPEANFYLLPSRGWELLLGAMLALYLQKHPQPKGPVAGIGALAGLGLIGLSVVLFKEDTPFPSLVTLAPVVGTGLILLCATPHNIAGKMLGHPILVGVGLISYSAYLWHQPLFAFARLQGTKEFSPMLITLLIGLTFVLAWGSWRYVEKPFRNRAFLSRTAIFVLSGALLAVLLAIGGAFHASKGLLNRYDGPQRAWASITPEVRKAYNNHGYDQATKEALNGTDDAPLVLLIGDSYSRDFFNIIAETGAFADYRIAGVRVSPQCQIYTDSGFRSPIAHSRCARFALDQSLLAQAEVVILSFSWTPWAADAIEDSITALNLRADQKLLVIGTKHLPYDLRQLIRSDLAQAQTLRVSPDPERVQINQKMQNLLSADVFVDVIGATCGADLHCPVITPDGALIAHDGFHVTPDGARFLGQQIFTQPPLAGFVAR